MCDRGTNVKTKVELYYYYFLYYLSKLQVSVAMSMRQRTAQNDQMADALLTICVARPL